MKKTHILALIAALLLAATQISCKGGGQETTNSPNNLGAQNNQQVNAAPGTVTNIQFNNFHDSPPTPEGTFGFGVLYKSIAAATEGNHDLPVYMDLGLNPTTVPDCFADMLQVYPDEYILYPQNDDQIRFVQYSHVEEVENDGLIGDLVDGDLTPIAELNDIQNSRIEVVYFGGTYNNEAYASFTLNFDTNTWSGIVLGKYNIAVSGSIEGQFFYSETITEFKNPGISVSGMIAGSFYGPEVGDIAGVIDITRKGERIVDLFDGQKVDVNLPAN